MQRRIIFTVAGVAAMGTLGMVAPQTAQAQAAQNGGMFNPDKTPPVSMDFEDTPVRKALAQFFRKTKADFTLDNSVTGMVTLRFTEQPFENALRLILRSGTVPLTYTRENGVYKITAGKLPTEAGQAIATPGENTPEPNTPLLPITLELRDTPIRDALTQMFNTAKVSYSIDPAVSGFVSIKVTELPFEDALRLVLRSATLPLTYTRESGVFLVKVRPITTEVTRVAPPPATVAANTAPTTSGPQFEFLQLNYIDPYDLKDLLHLTFVPFFARGNGGNNGGQGGVPTGGGGNNGGTVGGLAGGTGIGGVGGVGPNGNGVLLFGGNNGGNIGGRVGP